MTALDDLVGTTLQTCQIDINCSSEEVLTCKKCSRRFCVIHSATFSPNFCKDCFKELSAIIDKDFTVTENSYDSETDTVKIEKKTCIRIQLDGPDYVFYTKWINKLTDDDLKIVREFHYFIVKLIEHENETRKVEKRRKIREMPTPMAISKTTTIKTQRVAKPVDLRAKLRSIMPNAPDSLIDAMLAAGQGAISNEKE